MNRVYIAGCGGMLGRDVYRVFYDNHFDIMATDIDVNESWLTYGDVRNYDQMVEQIGKFAPDVIINLAALTDLEYCEQNSQNAYDTNFLGPVCLSNIANSVSIPFVHISTAGIFDGSQEFYDETDIPNPLSVYGKTKYEGELYVQKKPKHYIFRAGWMMGGLNKDKKFIFKIYNQIRNGASVLHVVDDKLGTPTYTKDFANSVYRHLTESSPYGLYNQVCDGSCSRYDVALEFVRLLGVDVSVEIVNSDYFKEEYFAPRPASEKLINKRLNDLGINYMRDWKVCLAEYVDEFGGLDK